MTPLRALARRASSAAAATTTMTTVTRAFASRRAPPPPMTSIEDVWEEVLDERTGKTYHWNVETDETTELGAPKPTTYSALDPTMPAPNGTRGAPPPQRAHHDDRGGGSIVGGLGGMIAQGAAWGMGSSLGHRAIGGIFGYGGGSSSASEGGGYFGGDTSAPAPPDFGGRSGEFDYDDDGFGDGSDDASVFDFFSED